MYKNEIKEKYMKGNKAGYITIGIARDIVSSWEEEYTRCDCRTCGEDCPAKMEIERFPVDAGGKGQCLRNERYKSKFAFRNVDGNVIVIPDEVIENIVNRMFERLTEREEIR